MRVVALVSGGKDCTYAMMKCVQYGHEIVALANLHPPPTVAEEMDSFMYQTVGHGHVEAVAKAMGVPLFRRAISGTAVEQRLRYEKTPGDEVEDLFKARMRNSPGINRRPLFLRVFAMLL